MLHLKDINNKAVNVYYGNRANEKSPNFENWNARRTNKGKSQKI